MKTAVSILFLILALPIAGCSPAAGPEDTDADPEPVENVEQAEKEAVVENLPESPAASATPEMEAAQPAPTATAEVVPASPTPTVTVPAFTPEPVNADDAGQIYAAAIRQVYFVEHSFGGDPAEFPLVYIISTTTDGKLLEAPPSTPTEIGLELREAIDAALEDRPFDIIWVSSREDVPIDEGGQIAGGQGIYLTLGNILPQEDGTVQLPMHMVCGTLCLSGKTYVLEQEAGVWQVTGNVGLVIEA